jgi:tRNA(fMet)-specific endonuclease VapC
VSDASPHTRGILDTATVILLEKLADASALPAEPLITAVTLAELSVGPLVARGESERVARQTQLQQAEADFKPLPFDADAARTFGRVAASLRRSGRKATARTYDAMIAATAVANDLPIYTCNPTDFKGIDGLEVVAVPVADDPPTPSTSEQTAHETAHNPENPQQPG